MPTYPFKTLVDWYNFARAVKTQVSDGTTLGIPSDIAVAASSAAEIFETAYLVATDPPTRTSGTIADRDQKLDDFKKAVRPVVSFIQSSETIGDEVRTNLMLRIYDRTPTPTPVIGYAPMVELVLTSPTSLRAFVRDPGDPDRRAKPAGQRAILVLVHENDGQAPPADAAAWRLYGQEARSTFDVFLPELNAPKAIWMRCAYVSNRNQNGPLSEAAKVVLPGTGLAASEVESATPMRLAA